MNTYILLLNKYISYVLLTHTNEAYCAAAFVFALSSSYLAFNSLYSASTPSLTKQKLYNTISDIKNFFLYCFWT